MPVYNGACIEGGIVVPDALVIDGPIAPAEFQIPTSLAQLLKIQGKPIPPPLKGMVLIDTGATKSCVESAIISSLGVEPVGLMVVSTAKGATKASLYPARLLIGGGETLQPIDIELNSFICVDLSKPSSSAHTLIGLIGRDILKLCMFVYNGPAGTYSLAI